MQPEGTAFQVGTALGVAIVSTIAISRTDDYLADRPGTDPLVGLTAGFQAAFLACAVLAAAGAALALLLPGRPRRAAREQLRPVALPAGGD